MSREVCQHFAPLGQNCARCSIDPISLAGILLREHDNAGQAMRYADRKAAYLVAMGNAVGLDYAKAAQVLKAQGGAT